MSLSIAIPTRNRLSFLLEALASIEHSAISEYADYGPPMEVHVYDNASDPLTVKKLHSLRYKRFLLRIHCLSSNIGMVANIHRAIIGPESDYVWLLSDHMIIHQCIYYLSHVLTEFSPDFAVFGIKGYPRLAKSPVHILNTSTLGPLSASALMFCLGNISSNVHRRSVRAVFGSQYECSDIGTEYPHLLCLEAIGRHSRCLWIEGCSSFNITKKVVPSYNALPARFIDYPLIQKKISRVLFSGVARFLFLPPRLYITSLAYQLLTDIQNNAYSSLVDWTKIFYLLFRANGFIVMSIVVLFLILNVFR